MNIPDGYPFNGEVCFVNGSTNLKDYLFGGFIDDGRDEKAASVMKRLIEKYGIPECGRNRAAFISKHYVIKFPLNDAGEGDNDWEGSVSSEIYAKSRYITLDDFVCVIQEKLTMIPDNEFSYESLPDWVGGIDCGQVGYDKKGNLKAFDYGLN